MSLLTTVQSAMVLCGLPQPQAVLSNSDQTVSEFVAYAQDVGDELAERYFWRQLNIPTTIIGDGTSTLWPLPTDWAQFSPGQRLFSSLFPTLPIVGPVTNEQITQMQASPSFPTRPIWRLIGGALEIWPALGLTETVTFNYYSTNWIADAPGLTRKLVWSADSDFSMIDEKALRRGIVWRWKQSKGLDYAEDFRRFEMTLDRAAGRDNTGRIVNMAARPLDLDGWFPGTVTYTAP